MTGADDGSRTHTLFRGADFKSAASTVSPRPQPRSSFAGAVLRIAAEGADQCPQLLGRRFEPGPLGAAQHQRRSEIAAPEIGIGADLDVGVALLQFGEPLRDRAFGESAADAAAQHLV